MTRNLKLLYVAFGLILSLGAADAALAACLGPAEIQQAKNSGRILSLESVSQRAGVGPGTDIKLLGSQVCEKGGALVYELSVLDSSGNAGTVLVDAASGKRLN